MTTPDGTEGIPEKNAATLEPVVIEVIDGPSAGARLRVAAGTVFIGSGETCELSLKDPAVSRRHLCIELLPGVVRVQDLVSRNGTTYLGAKIHEARVPIGGSVTLGRTTLRFSPVDGAAPVSGREELHGLFGRSLPMRQLFALMERLGPLDTTVLIRGETGAGKDSVARALHALSPRAAKPFVVFDCASVNPNLVESELFGHAKGAFTGADRARVGAVEAALDGTLLLSEVGDLPAELQPKLLRVLDQREFKRTGEQLVRKATCRILSATHRDLEAESKAGRFRSDLYFRLSGAELVVPPLREHREDIPELVRRFARAAAGVDVTLSPATSAGLQCDPWPGNVRELKNSVERAVALGELPRMTGEGRGEVTFKEARADLLVQFERDYLAALLDRHHGNVSGAARESGLSRSQFYRLLEKHRIAAEPE